MKTILTFCFSVLTISCLLAINPVKGKIEINKINAIEEGVDNIDQELDQLLNAADLIKAENLTLQEFETQHAELADAVNVEADVDTGLLEGSPNSPVGIPGFWWGFCFGIIGLIVVYVAMEDGEERKEQAKNALYGCIASALVSGVLYAILIAAAL